MSDADGFLSASIMYNWLVEKGETNLVPIIPEGKVHGILTHLIPEDLDLLITPDGSSSEPEKHKTMAKMGIDVLVLDHHELTEDESEYSVIVNPFLPDCPYENKNLSGGGVVFRFLSALDEDLQEDIVSKYIDLAAASIVTDVMNLRSMENKAIVNEGLSQIRSPYFEAFIKADQRLDPEKEVTPFSIGWYIGPAINAVIRVGDLEVKHELFEALTLQKDANQVTARVLSLKRSQDSALKPVIDRIAFNLVKEKKDRNKIIFTTVPNSAHKSVTGLIAGKMTSLYNRPIFLGRVNPQGTHWSGSARSINNSNLENLKDFCEESGLFDWVRGHQAAFGWQIPIENIDAFIAYAEEKLPELEIAETATFEADFGNSDFIDSFEILSKLGKHSGNGFDDIKIYCEIPYNHERAKVIGKKANTLVLNEPQSGLELIAFRVKADNLPTDNCLMRVVGTPQINEYMGRRKPQIVIQNFEFVDFKDMIL